MKIRQRISACTLLLMFLVSLVAPVFAYTVPTDTVVYVTDTGSKYHRAGCSYLTSSHSMTISQAESRGYEPCSRCDPDVKTGNYVSGWEGTSGGKSSQNSPSFQSSTYRQWSVSDIVKAILLAPVFLFGTAYIVWFLCCFVCALFAPAVDYIRDLIRRKRK